MADNLDKVFDQAEDLETEFNEAQDLSQSEPSLGSQVAQGAVDLGRGVTEGLTLGFADELAGVASATGQSAMEFLRGEQGKGWLEKYQAEKAKQEALSKESAERSPYLYGGGELAGTLAPALLTAGAAAPAAIGRGLVSRAGRAALSTGISGGIQAAGKSTGELGTEAGREQLLKDVGTGVAVGGAFGAATGAAAPILSKAGEKVSSKLGEYVDDSPRLKQLGMAYKKGTSGKEITTGQKSVERVAREQLGDIKDISNRFIKAEDQLGKSLEESLLKASQEGITIGDDLLIESLEEVQNSISKGIAPASRQVKAKIESAIYHLRNEDLSPARANDLRKAILEIRDATDNPVLKQYAQEIQSSIKNQIVENVPDAAKLSKQFTDLRKAGSETLLAKGQPSEFADMWIGDLKRPDLEVSKEVTSLLSKLRSPGAQEESKRGFVQLIDNLKKYEQDNPELLKKLGLDVGKLEKDIIGKADEFALSKQMLGYEPHASPSSLKALALGPSKTGLGYALSGAQLAGTTKRVVGKAIKPIADISKKVYSLPKEGLSSIAAGFKQSEVGGLTHLGEALERGIAEGNRTAQNAALFSILQNPNAREHLQNLNLFGDEE